MSLTREQVLYLINTKGAGDWKNIHSITFNTLNPICLHEYGVRNDPIPGKGIEFVDIELENEEYLCGFYITESVPPTNRRENNEYMESFMPVEEIDRISFITDRDNFPSYATPPANKW